ncbi:hypothetical protein [Herbiconiux sp. UC225_62]|uniref:hypothetical protein n=1 Tax=Herbiconiux sp. UC225_62 TaxID=3350168 RepID=UPI0036D28C91
MDDKGDEERIGWRELDTLAAESHWNAFDNLLPLPAGRLTLDVAGDSRTHPVYHLRSLGHSRRSAASHSSARHQQ